MEKHDGAIRESQENIVVDIALVDVQHNMW